MPDFKALYYKEPFRTKIKTRVVELLDYDAEKQCRALVLADSLFYPEGGGQPGDTGILIDEDKNEYRVLDCRFVNDKPTVFIAEETGVRVGSEVEAQIDAARRFSFMQHHSGEHIISGLADSMYGCNNVGFHINEEMMTIDFDKPLNATQMTKLERLANEKVWANLPINELFPDPEEAAAIRYRSKKDVGDNIRLIQVPGVDICACCGTHLDYTGKIGLIKFIDYYPHRGGTRIDILCGDKAYEYCVKLENNVKKASAALSLPWQELADGVENEVKIKEKMRKEIAALKCELTSLLIKNAVDIKEQSASDINKPEVVFKAGDLLCLISESLGSKELRGQAKFGSDKAGRSFAVFGIGEDNLISYAAAAPEKGCELKAVKADLTSGLLNFLKQSEGHKGGGGKGYVSGRLQMNKNELVELLKAFAEKKCINGRQ